MINSLICLVGILALIGTAAFAYLKGDTAERWGAALICISWFAGDDVSLLFGNMFPRIAQELTLLAMDVALAFGFLLLALRFAKVWLGVAMLMQSAELALHGAVMADWGIPYRQYIIFNNLVSVGILLLLIAATTTVWMRRARGPHVRSQAVGGGDHDFLALS